MSVEEKLTFPEDEIRLSITPYCNMKCVYCHNEGNKELDQMTYDRAMEIVEVCKNYGIKEVRLTGGEPTTSIYLNEICKSIKDRFNLKVSINTNAIEINKIINLINKKLVDEVVVGIDFFDAAVSKSSPVGENSSTILSNILRIKSAGCNVSIDSVFDGNTDNTAKLVQWSLQNHIRIKVIEVVKGLCAENNEYDAMVNYITKKFDLLYKTDVRGEIVGYNGDFLNVSFFHSLCRKKRCDICRRIQFRITSNGIIKFCLFTQKDDVDLNVLGIKDGIKKGLEKSIILQS